MTERRVRRLTEGWVYRPASGIPARHYQAWGGPAKGADGGPPRPRTAADAAESRRIARDPDRMVEITRRKMAKEERIAELIDFLEGVALNLPTNGAAPEAEMALRVAAADKALDRLEGKPAQTNKNLNVNVLDGISIDQQRAVLAALDTIARGEEGVAGGIAEADC